MNKILKLIDDNLLFAISLMLIVFIPLYPKWPMFDVLPGYIVRIRLEDFLVLFSFLIWGIYVLRGKIKLKEIPLFKPILAYLVVGLLSTLSAIFITQTVTTETYQILKLYLHYFRRIEYFSLFFIFYSAISTKEQIKYYLTALVGTVVGVFVYGFGQKYLYWPAYSTMNREFSKGIVLYLSEHARVLSTFGGHYDLAAYIMLTLTIVIGIAFTIKKWWLSAILLFIALCEYWLLNLTASRTSFMAFLASVSILFLFLAFKKGWFWAGKRLFIIVFVSMSIMLTIGPMSERFAQVIKLQDLKTDFNKALRPPPPDAIELRDDIPLEEQLAMVASQSDVPPSPVKPTPTPVAAQVKARPDDVYEDPYVQEATSSAEATASAVVHADYSENALKYGLSTGIRLDTLWPRAIAAFKTNPLLGTGYSTLVKAVVWEQTPAESTDNDYLRLLGETGLLGFITFMSIFGLSIAIFYKAFRKSSEPLYYGLFAAGIGISIGLIINAMYIDVFESSKVAYSYWSFMGLFLALALLTLKDKKNHKKTK
ncbi:hypothetical protein GYA49_03365 [Candidatus Beckwithbacteria bacterium]|nr:hypothetical protein [Candidatus Beckwithbacteria bacterium]